MAWYLSATGHYLGQCWHRPESPDGITRPQWVKFYKILRSMLKYYEVLTIEISMAHFSWKLGTQHKYLAHVNTWVQQGSAYNLNYKRSVIKKKHLTFVCYWHKDWVGTKYLWLTMDQNWLPGGRLNIKRSYKNRDPMLKIRWSHDSLIFKMESPYLRKVVFILRWGPDPNQHFSDHCDILPHLKMTLV